jgi:hypothetical protein
MLDIGIAMIVGLGLIAAATYYGLRAIADALRKG